LDLHLHDSEGHYNYKTLRGLRIPGEFQWGRFRELEMPKYVGQARTKPVQRNTEDLREFSGNKSQ
jgi:hypothetical protein